MDNQQTGTNRSQASSYRVNTLLPEIQERSTFIRLNADAIADAHIGVVESGSIVLKPTEQGYQIVAVGTSAKIDAIDLHQSTIEITLNNRLIMPALVNAHTHLDLTHIGPVNHDTEEGFVQWVDMIRENRKSDDESIRQAVRLGIAKSIAGGSIAVGDIAGAPAGRITDAPAYELAASPLIGVSYLEFFGIGKTAQLAIEKVQAYLDGQYPKTEAALKQSQVQIGLQPHATNTIDLSVYKWIAQRGSAMGIPVSTHLAETIEERMFIHDGIGPQRAMLQRFGVWDDSILDHIAKGNHPVEHLREVLAVAPMLVAHVNDATDAAIECLASTNTSVAYCPRASEYFGAAKHFGQHRYRDMLAAGVHVCLGTDSIVNLDTPERISILDEMRLLARRDGTEAKTLIAMATINGCKAMGLDPSRFTLSQGSFPHGLIALPIEHSGPTCTELWPKIMNGNQSPEWIFLSEKQHS